MLESITFEVIGDQRLHCESCELRVKRLLKGVQGVRQASADARGQQINVLFDAARVDPVAIAERLREAGYDTRVAGASQDSAE